MAGGSIDGVTSFVPARVARQQAAAPSPPDGPRQDRFSSSVLMADISGFTRLTETLARRGEVGAEDLTRCLNIYFGRLIDLIVEHGGDIVKFAGDALLAVWPADVRLSLRVGVGAGSFAILDVGGVDGRRELIATGDALAGMNMATATARPGEMGLSPDAFALVRDSFDGDVLPDGSIRVQRVREPVPPR